jgi:hypothetical protein
VLQLERTFQLLRFNNGVDSELAGVAVVRVLEPAFPLLEHPACAPVDESRRRS